MHEIEEHLHPLVELMLARMKSHPEEFRDGYLGAPDEPWAAGRWGYALRAIDTHGTEREKQLVAETCRGIGMGEAHEWAMDELLNGEERRAKAKQEEIDYMMKMQAQMAHQQLSAYRNNLATATGVGSVSSSGQSAYGAAGGNTFQKLIDKVTGK